MLSKDLVKEIQNAGSVVSPSDLQSRFEAAAETCLIENIVGSISRADAITNAVLNTHLDSAFSEFVEGFPDLSQELGGAIETFGETCNGAIDQTLGTFDALTSDLDGCDAAKSAKRKLLLSRIHAQLFPLFRNQLKQLDELAWDRMRKSLVQLRLGDPSLLKEMEKSVKDSDTFFRETSSRMICQGATWSADQDRLQMVSKMRRFVVERLQTARLQGAYVPGMLRRPVAVSLHYLATHPFQLLDSIQDSLSYEEDMDWQPDAKVMAIPKGGLKSSPATKTRR
jgi:hypothetical protein